MVWSCWISRTHNLMIMYNSMKYYVSLIQVILLFASCSNQKKTEPLLLNHQTIDIGDDFIGYGGFLAFSPDAIVGIDYAPSMQPFFCLKQNESPQTLFYFGGKGRGPNEFVMPYSIQHIDRQLIGIFDVTTMTYYESPIPCENDEIVINKSVKIHSQVSRIIKTSFNQYIGLAFDERMFSLMDSTGILVSSFFEYPYRDNKERKMADRSSAYQGTLSINPSKNRFVYSSYKGEIIHLYEIENNNIKTIAKIENDYPVYKGIFDTGVGAGIAYGANGKLGYIATYVTDNFVYAIFCGETLLEHGRKVNYEGKILRVFDWNGVLVKEYEFDVPCSYFCVSDDDNIIWAIASNPDISIVYFVLEDEQSIKELAFLKSLPDYVDAKIIDGGLFLDFDTTKYIYNIVKSDTIIKGKTQNIYQIVFNEKSTTIDEENN